MNKRILSILLIATLTLGVSYWGTRLLTDESVDFKEQSSAPANPTADRWKAYFKTDGSLYKPDENGVETELAGDASLIQGADGDTSVQVVSFERERFGSITHLDVVFGKDVIGHD